MDENDFIVAYSANRCDIGRACMYEDLVSQYQFALDRRNLKTWGDMISYNNQMWCSVKAETAADALEEFFKKLKKERSNDNANTGK